MAKTKVTKELADKLAGIACKQIDAARRFRQPRLSDIQKSEDLYFMKKQPALKGRFNFPLPILSGFVDTLLSKIDDEPNITYTHDDEADLKIAKKVTALWTRISSDPLGSWSGIDRDVKKFAIFSGRGNYKLYTSSENGFTSNLEAVDYYDFLFEPKGGGNLENNMFCGQERIIKTNYDLDKGVEDGIYDKKQVAILKLKNDSSDFKKDDQEKADEKNNRITLMGLDQEMNDYVGQPVYCFTEWYMIWEGKRYYILLDEKSKSWVRCEELKELFSNKLYPFVSFATHNDPKNFLSKAPVDDIRPVAIGMQQIFNQGLNNIQKRNFGMKAIDTSIFPNPNQLQDYMPDGLVIADTKNGQKSMREGIYQLETPDNTQMTINLTNFLDNFLGKNTGITAASQGASDKDTKVGIYYGDLQQVADRLGLYNKAYSEAWAGLGKRFYDGLKDNLNESEAIKIIGLKGVEWDTLTSKEIKSLNCDLSLNIKGGNAESQADEVKKKTKEAALGVISKLPELKGFVSPKWLGEEILRTAGFEESEIRAATDLEGGSDQEILSEAMQAIQLIIKGKEPKINRGATTAYLQKINDFAHETDDLDDETYRRLIAFMEKHMPIAAENAARKAQSILAKAGINLQQVPDMNKQPGGMPGAMPSGMPPMPSTPGGTASRSGQMSEQMTPPMPQMPV